MKTILYYLILIVLMVFAAALVSCVVVFLPVDNFAPFIAAAGGVAVYTQKRKIFEFLDKLFNKNKL